MAQPNPYVPATDFSEYQTANPSAPFNGANLDVETTALELTIGQITANMALIQRDDGALANGSVHVNAFSTAALALMASASWTVQGAWVTATAYVVGDVVTNGTGSYVCAVAHTAGTFATDLAASKWVTIFDSNALSAFLRSGSSSLTTAPSASGTDSLAVGNGSVVANTRAIAIGKGRAGGVDSLAIAIGNSTSTYGATGTEAIAIGKQAKASGTNSTVVGGTTNTASGSTDTVVGGNSNTANSGVNLYATVVGGNSNSATPTKSTIVGGNGNTISGSGASGAIVGGTSNIVSGGSGAVVGGTGNEVSATYAACVGGAGLFARRQGMVAFGYRSSGNTFGQGGLVTYNVQTTDATPAVLIHGNTALALTIASGTALAFTALVCGRRSDVVGECAAYELKGLIANNAGTTALIGSITKTVIAESDSAWDCTAVANNADDTLDITVTGAAAKTIDWTASIHFVEMNPS